MTEKILKRPDPPEGEVPIWYNLKTTIDPDTNTVFPFEMLRAELATVILAGMDTSGFQLSWTFAILATHLKIAEKLFEELTKHGFCNSDVNFEELGMLPYLNAVIKEALRLLYVIPFGLTRYLDKDTSILNYRLPKGTIIMIPGTSAMNTEAEWNDSDVVRPERWLSGEDLSEVFRSVTNGTKRLSWTKIGDVGDSFDRCDGFDGISFEQRPEFRALVAKYERCGCD